MGYLAVQIAWWLIKQCEKHGGIPDLRKLQCMVCMAQAWHIGMTGKPLFDDLIEIGTDGPMVIGVEREFMGGVYRPPMLVIPEMFNDFSDYIARITEDKTADEMKTDLMSRKPFKETPLGQPVKFSALREYYVHEFYGPDEEDNPRTNMTEEAIRAKIQESFTEQELQDILKAFEEENQKEV